MPYAEVNDIRMYYEEMGSGTPLVLMHAAAGAIDDPVFGWADLMSLFAERYRVIHVEHRGHGRTNNPAGKITYEMIASDVCAFIEQLGLGPAHIGGVSDGGITALVIDDPAGPGTDARHSRPELLQRRASPLSNHIRGRREDRA